jgi:hypothetical protein
MDVPAKPYWSNTDKLQSLVAYGDWLNAIARASFLNDSGHPEMFFFISEDGGVNGYQFREGLENVEKNSIVLQQAQQIKPFGTIHVKIVDVAPLGWLKQIWDNPSQKCLLVTVESRLGDTRAWQIRSSLPRRGHP